MSISLGPASSPPNPQSPLTCQASLCLSAHLAGPQEETDRLFVDLSLPKGQRVGHQGARRIINVTRVSLRLQSQSPATTSISFRSQCHLIWVKTYPRVDKWLAWVTELVHTPRALFSHLLFRNLLPAPSYLTVGSSSAPPGASAPPCPTA